MSKTHSILLFFLAAIALNADDLTTRDGKVYKNYKALSHDDGYLTIMYEDGGGKIPLANLPDALQKQYGYDPAKAAYAVTMTEQIDHDQALAVEKAQEAAAEAKQKQMSSQVAPPAGAGTQTMGLTISPPKSSKSALSPDEVASIQGQISDLNADIAFMQDQEGKVVNQRLTTDGNRVSNGAYADKITSDQEQIQQLKQELRTP